MGGGYFLDDTALPASLGQDRGVQSIAFRTYVKSGTMNGEEIPRDLQGRTGKHSCIVCLRVIPAEEYFRNDFICDECIETPGGSSEEEMEKGESGGDPVMKSSAGGE